MGGLAGCNDGGSGCDGNDNGGGGCGVACCLLSLNDRDGVVEVVVVIQDKYVPAIWKCKITKNPRIKVITVNFT